MKQTTKHCPKCDKIKILSDFGKSSNSNDGIYKYCKNCSNEISKKYQKTKKGLVTRIYHDQRSRSKKRGHELPTYTKQELKDWLHSQKKFHVLYDNWKRLDFQKDYVPSVDRKDDYIGYTMDNIQLMTWKENNEKFQRDTKNGINNKGSKSVVQLEKDGTFVAEFYSMSEAERVTGISTSSISKCCHNNKNYSHSGGFIWKYGNRKDFK